MKPVSFLVMVLLLIYLMIGACISVDVLLEHQFERDGHPIQQQMIFVDRSAVDMSPNLNFGDLVVVENSSKIGVITSDEAMLTGYKSFNLSGDVILYRPYGFQNQPPILSRALRYVIIGDPMWKDGPAAPFSGYITKADNYALIDQMAAKILGPANLSYIYTHKDGLMEVGRDAYVDENTGLSIYNTTNGTFVAFSISFLTPVKEEWVIGVAKTKIPYSSDWTDSENWWPFWK